MYISIDLGGTKTRLAVSKDLHGLDAIEKFSSLKNLNEQKDKLTQLLTPILKSNSVEAVSIGIPGTFDISSKKFLKVPNYQLLEGKGFDYFSDLFEADTKILINNDAALACLGEAVHGAGKSFKNVAYLTLSTGVGGAVINGKRLSDASRSFEPGHHIINYKDTTRDNSGFEGSMESYLSGTGFTKRYGISPAECTDASIWEEYGYILGVCIVNVCAFWNPDVIVLGGSVSNKYDYFISGLNNYLSNITGLAIPPVKKSLLEDDAGLIGGFEFISQKVA